MGTIKKAAAKLVFRQFADHLAGTLKPSPPRKTSGATPGAAPK